MVREIATHLGITGCSVNCILKDLFDEDYITLGDATQTTYISTLKKPAGIRGGSIRAWLLRIVINAYYDELRRMHVHPFVQLELTDQAGECDEYPPRKVGDSSQSDGYFEHKELETAIRYYLLEISPEYRKVLVLVVLQGLSYFKAAESLGEPIGIMRLKRAKQHLRGEVCAVFCPTFCIVYLYQNSLLLLFNHLSLFDYLPKTGNQNG